MWSVSTDNYQELGCRPLQREEGREGRMRLLNIWRMRKLTRGIKPLGLHLWSLVFKIPKGQPRTFTVLARGAPRKGWCGEFLTVLWHLCCAWRGVPAQGQLVSSAWAPSELGVLQKEEGGGAGQEGPGSSGAHR